MTNENKKYLNYMTQYANYMSDEGFFDLVDYIIEKNELDIDLFIEISELMESIHDSINQKLFDKMLESTDDSDLHLIIDLLTAIDNEDISRLDNLTDGYFMDYMFENGINDPDYFIETADADLRANGYDADALYWVKDIDEEAEYLQLNAYRNDLTTRTAADVILEFFEEYFK